MPKIKADAALIRIEETQAALRDSIERAKKLTEESDRLVRRHRKPVAVPSKPVS